MVLAVEARPHARDVDVARARVVDDVASAVARPVVRPGDLAALPGGGRDERLRLDLPAGRQRVRPADVDLARPAVVAHEQHDVDPGLRRVREDARVRRLAHAREHVRAHDPVVVREAAAVGRARDPGRVVLAVEEQVDPAVRRVPERVGARHVAHVEARPGARDDRVGGVLAPRAGDGVGVGQADAARGVVRGVVHVPAAERVLDAPGDVPDRGEDQLVRRVVPQRAPVERLPEVAEGRETGHRRVRGRRGGDAAHGAGERAGRGRRAEHDGTAQERATGQGTRDGWARVVRHAASAVRERGGRPPLSRRPVTRVNTIMRTAERPDGGRRPGAGRPGGRPPTDESARRPGSPPRPRNRDEEDPWPR